TRASTTASGGTPAAVETSRPSRAGRASACCETAGPCRVATTRGARSGAASGNTRACFATARRPNAGARATGTGRAAAHGSSGRSTLTETHDGTAASGEPVHGSGSQAKGAAARARFDLRPRRIPSGEAPTGDSRRHAATALQGRNREELAGVPGTGGSRAREQHALLDRSAERNSWRRREALLAVIF